MWAIPDEPAHGVFERALEQRLLNTFVALDPEFFPLLVRVALRFLNSLQRLLKLLRDVPSR